MRMFGFVSVIILTFLIGTFASASDLLVNTVKGKTWIQSSSCTKAKNEARLFCRATGKKLKSENCRQSSARLKEIEVSQCVPDRYRSYIGIKQREDDANCWGTALFANGASEGRLGLSSDLFIQKMNSPLCRRLELNESPIYGDTIRMFWPSGWDKMMGCYESESEVSGYCDVHGITYVSPNLVFSKRDVDRDSLWSLNNRKSAFSEYDLSESCFQVNRDSLPHECQNKPWAEVYRCQSFSSYIQKHQAEPGMSQVLELRQLLSGVNRTHQDLIWKNRVLPSFQAITDANQVLGVIASEYCADWVHPETGKKWDFRYGFQNPKEIMKLKKSEKNPVFWSMLMSCQDAQRLIFPNEIRYESYLDEDH